MTTASTETHSTLRETIRTWFEGKEGSDLKETLGDVLREAGLSAETLKEFREALEAFAERAAAHIADSAALEEKLTELLMNTVPVAKKHGETVVKELSAHLKEVGEFAKRASAYTVDAAELEETLSQLVSNTVSAAKTHGAAAVREMSAHLGSITEQHFITDLKDFAEQLSQGEKTDALYGVTAKITARLNNFIKRAENLANNLARPAMVGSPAPFAGKASQEASSSVVFGNVSETWLGGGLDSRAARVAFGVLGAGIAVHGVGAVSQGFRGRVRPGAPEGAKPETDWKQLVQGTLEVAAGAASIIYGVKGR